MYISRAADVCSICSYINQVLGHRRSLFWGCVCVASLSGGSILCQFRLKLLMWPWGGLAANRVKSSISETEAWSSGAPAAWPENTSDQVCFCVFTSQSCWSYFFLSPALCFSSTSSYSSLLRRSRHLHWGFGSREIWSLLLLNKMFNSGWFELHFRHSWSLSVRGSEVKWAYTALLWRRC